MTFMSMKETERWDDSSGTKQFADANPNPDVSNWILLKI